MSITGSTLPISVREISTPYTVWGEENVNIVESSNNKIYISRGGGFRYRVTLNIIPFNILSSESAVRFEFLRAYLTRNPSFSIPILNTIPNQIVGSPEVIASFTDNEPGFDTVLVDTGTFTGDFQPGQYIKFSNKEKVYQVGDYNSGTGVITLTQKLRQKVNPENAINKTISYAGVDYYGTAFDGITGSFVNEDFGNPVASIDDGILGRISPLVLIENI